MNKSSLYISLLALVVSAAALVTTTRQPQVSADAEKIAAVLNEKPQIIIDALQNFEKVQRENQEKAAAQAFLDNIDELNNNADTPFIGNADAKVVMVEFFDFSCGYCKRLAPAIEKLIDENPDVKFVFKPITFVSPISNYAARAALAAHKQGKFMPMYKAMLSAPRLTEVSINDMAKEAGLDMDAFKAEVNSENVNKTIKDVAALAEKVQVRGVPSLVLNGKPLQSVDVNTIQNAINNLK